MFDYQKGDHGLISLVCVFCLDRRNQSEKHKFQSRTSVSQLQHDLINIEIEHSQSVREQTTFLKMLLERKSGSEVDRDPKSRPSRAVGGGAPHSQSLH